MTHRPEKSIVLVGLMGAGKSAVGRRLAIRLGLGFVDTDFKIEHEFGLDIAGIFERFGEARFRECERQLIARLVEGPPQVIAVGGGAFADDGSRELILRRCYSVWLEADVSTLAQRVSRGNDRPLLAGRDPIIALAELCEQRSPAYAMAHARIRSDDAPLEIVVERIAAAIGGRQG